MDLEDQTLVHTPALTINIERVQSVVSVLGDKYKINLHTIGKREGGYIFEIKTCGPEGKEFAKGLERGDQIIVIHSNGSVKFVYGPLQKGRLYVPNH